MNSLTGRFQDLLRVDGVVAEFLASQTMEISCGLAVIFCVSRPIWIFAANSVATEAGWSASISKRQRRAYPIARSLSVWFSEIIFL